MRICQICPRFPPYVGGVETYVHEVSVRLAKEFDVEVLTTDPSGKLVRKESVEGVTIRRFKSYAPSGAYYFSLDLFNYLKKNSDKYDVIHAHNYHAFPALFATLFKRRNKLIFTPYYHGRSGSIVRNILLKPYKLFGSTIFKKSDEIICISDYEKKLVKNDFGVDAIVIPCGINLNTIRRIDNFKFHGKLIFYVGRIEKYKNIDIIIKSMKYLDDYYFYIAGKGNFEKELKNLIKKQRLEDRVKFIGYVDEVTKYKWLKTCSVFVNLSAVEAFGITVLEALACGKPVVVSNRGALREFAEKFNCVFTVGDKISPEELAEIIKKASEAEVQVNLKEYSWDTITERIKDIYINL